jgi:putative NIF3 family GTP cyclohydrolase 1 type 2
VQLAQRLGLLSEMQVGEANLVSVGYFLDQSTMTLEALGQTIERVLGRKPLLIGDQRRLVKKIAWCTGAAQGYMQEAIDAGADVYISGEISEPTTHLARESGVAYVAAGHHATERYGVAALGEFLAQQFGLCHHFVDVDNPV